MYKFLIILAVIILLSTLGGIENELNGIREQLEKQNTKQQDETKQ